MYEIPYFAKKKKRIKVKVIDNFERKKEKKMNISIILYISSPTPLFLLTKFCVYF